MAELTSNQVLARTPHITTLTGGTKRKTRFDWIFSASIQTSGGHGTGDGEKFANVAGKISCPFKIYSFKILFYEYSVLSSEVTRIDDYTFRYDYLLYSGATTPYGTVEIEYEEWFSYLSSFSGVLLTSQWKFSKNNNTQITTYTPSALCWFDQSTNKLSFEFDSVPYDWYRTADGILLFDWPSYWSSIGNKNNFETTDRLVQLKLVAIGD